MSHVVYVYVFCTRVSCTKTAEPIEMPFGGWPARLTASAVNRLDQYAGSPGNRDYTAMQNSLILP